MPAGPSKLNPMHATLFYACPAYKQFLRFDSSHYDHMRCDTPQHVILTYSKPCDAPQDGVKLTGLLNGTAGQGYQIRQFVNVDT